jgi:hypothetical protein
MALIVSSALENCCWRAECVDVFTHDHSDLTIAIAPDWSPSGSNGMVEELQYASQWNGQQA